MHGAIPPLPEYVFMAWFLVKHRDNFTFTIYGFIDGMGGKETLKRIVAIIPKLN
jgi:hypothetical protein